MEKLSRDFIEKVNEAADLLELVSEDTDLKKTGYNTWMGHCPNPDHEDSSPSFMVSKNRDGGTSWCCYGCHAGRKDITHKNFGSDAIAYVMWRSNWRGNTPLNFYKSVMYLANKYGVHKERSVYADVYDENYRLAYAANKSLPDIVIKYLKSRGLTEESIDKWLIGFSYCADKIPRIIFPLRDETENIIGFSKRVLPGEQENVGKYWNSRTTDWFRKSTYLYGINLLDTSFPEIRITEGVMDVIMARQYGVKNVVCTLGTSLTEDHVKRIKQLNLIPVICMDSDEAGIKATERAVRLFAEHEIYAKAFFVPSGKDLCDFSNVMKEDTEQFISEYSKPYWQFVLDKTISSYESHVNELRLKILPELKKTASSISSEDEMIIMKSFIKERTGILL